MSQLHDILTMVVKKKIFFFLVLKSDRGGQHLNLIVFSLDMFIRPVEESG